MYYVIGHHGSSKPPPHLVPSPSPSPRLHFDLRAFRCTHCSHDATCVEGAFTTKTDWEMVTLPKQKYRKKPMNIDDDWGYPHFRKPPYTKMLQKSEKQWLKHVKPSVILLIKNCDFACDPFEFHHLISAGAKPTTAQCESYSNVNVTLVLIVMIIGSIITKKIHSEDSYPKLTWYSPKWFIYMYIYIYILYASPPPRCLLWRVLQSRRTQVR